MGIIFRISFVFGLTKGDFGCILYDVGSIWSRCSPQNWKDASESPDGIRCAVPKKNRKIFGKAFDNAENCAIVYITRLIRRRLWVGRE